MPNGEEQWRALGELTRMTKLEQRRVLRMHSEAGFHADEGDAILLRQRLDDELFIITLRELGAQTDPSRVNETYSDIPAFGTLLSESPAFAQYLNYYLYFGGRFAAGRIANPCKRASTDNHAAEQAPADCNEPIFGLPAPPLCPGIWHGAREYARFLAHKVSAELLDEKIMAALRFLDDFVLDSQEKGQARDVFETELNAARRSTPGGDERHEFELWLRGLYMGDENRFRTLAAGLLKWAENRCNFYVSLEQNGPKQEWIAGWKAGKWKEGRFDSNNPILARCALVDFYWLSRILRADVTPRGMVAYSGHSWLRLLAMKREPLAKTEQDRLVLIAPRPRRQLEEANLRRILQEAADQESIREETVDELIVALYGHLDLPKNVERQQWKRLLRLMAASVRTEVDLEQDVIRPLLGAPYESFFLQTEQGAPARDEILRMEEVLRAAFAYACDLIQNAIEIAEDCEDRRKNPADYPDSPITTKSWRAVFDDELSEIDNQRREWRRDAGWSTGAGRDAKCDDSSETAGWSRRIWTGEDVPNLVGIALSGGGIRSATFNLGVLQQLQELDLLRHVDYLSTVSGGGYIGAWLIGNVRRTRYWLSRTTSWDKSIEHLRRYSNYLAPRNGLLSADTWSMWTTWIRNAFLIQLTGFTWLAFVLVFILALHPLFVGMGRLEHRSFNQGVFDLLLVIIGIIEGFYLWQLSKPYVPPKPGSLERFRVWALRRGNGFAKGAALIALIASFWGAGLLWGEVNQTPQAPQAYQEYSKILLRATGAWNQALIAVFLAALCVLAFSSYIPKSRSGWPAKLFWPVVIAAATAATAYLAVCAQLRLFGAMAPLYGGYHPEADWLAFIIGPPLTLTTAALAIGIYIGLLGRDSAEWSREWWTRFGSWIAMYGTAALGLAAGAVFAPLGIYALFQTHGKWMPELQFATIAGWVGSVVSGLLAGKSSRTGKDTHSPVLEWVARAGGLLFAVGAVAIVATVAYWALGEMILPTFVGGDYWQNLTDISKWPLGNWKFWVTLPVLLCLSMLFSDRFDLNTFGLNQFYRNRLVRCYLGATRWQPGKRQPHRFTAFDPADDIELACLTVKNTLFCGESFRGPLPIINCTLNLAGSADLTVHTRQSAAFTVTPLYCGSERKRVGYAPTPQYAGRVTLGQAISISGAAASPNMGYNTSPLVSFLLTMFNVRLGWWFPNPGTPAAQDTGSLSAAYLLRELFGTADDRMSFVNVSDGGHFENLGIYELVRRRARVIIAGDAECDENMTFGSLGRVIRTCETDLGARIQLDVDSLRKQETAMSRAHCAVGKITYSNGSIGYLIYLKSSLTGDEDVGVSQYQASHPAFPHETTADQFFSEDQFEAYRRLGYHIAQRAFVAAENEPPDLYGIASKLFDVWAPAAFDREAFLNSTKAFDAIWDRLRTDQSLAALFSELTGVDLLPPVGAAPVALGPVAPALTAGEIAACMELLQLMENVFLELRLDDFWDHPDNRGWAMLFMSWAQSPKIRSVWELMRRTYGIRFEYFCNQYLGLSRDEPVLRV